MRGRSAAELLSLPVRLHGLQVGRPVDVLLDRATFRAVGLDILCGDEVRRFLPLPTAAVGEEEIALSSALVLLDEDGVEFYRSRAFALSSLRGRPVRRNRRELGTLRDVVFGRDGSLIAVLVEIDGRTDRIDFDDTLAFAPNNRSAA